MPVMSVIPDLLHLILFFIIDQVRWGSGIIWAVGMCFDIWGKERSMEDGMNCP